MHRHLTHLGLALALAAGAAPLSAQDSAPPLQAVLANGYRFAYVVQGTGRPVVLLHGALEDYRRWDALGVKLADRARVIAYSARYHFPNPWRPDDPPTNLSTHAADLVAILRALHLEGTVLVADGWAATIALRAALREPGLVAAVALVEPLLGPPTAGAPPVPDPPRAGVNRLPETLGGPLRPATCEELGGLAVPLHVVTGTGSEPRVGASLGITRQCHPGTTSEILPGADLAETGAAALAEALARFVATLPPPPPVR